MLVTVLHRLENEPSSEKSSYVDVEEGKYYSKAVSWARQNGIIMGISETEFGPERNITREQLVTMLYRYAIYRGYDVAIGEELSRFKDSSLISDYALSSMQWAVGKGLIQGKEGMVLAPSDNAFGKAGYPTVVSMLSERAAIVSNIANYHILDGKYELNKLPFLFNQELKTRRGKVYATHWVKGADTVLTLNGARILTQNLPASNGLIQVLDRVMTPYVHDKIVDAINADASISIFARAIKRTGILSEKTNQGAYTVFAPNNAAMTLLGFQSVQDVELANLDDLKKIVRYHILHDRRFVYDYILSTGDTNMSKQTMLDGNSVDIKLVPNTSSPGSFSGITLRGLGNTNDVLLQKQDILTGDGVLHIVDQGLRLTQ